MYVGDYCIRQSLAGVVVNNRFNYGAIFSTEHEGTSRKSPDDAPWAILIKEDSVLQCIT